MNLLDLHPDVLFKLFRDYIPLRDKLHVLFDMKEFRPYLESRYAYLDRPLPFSTDYLSLLRHVRPGWYTGCTNWNHRFRLVIEARTLRFSLYHFILEGFEGKHRLNARYSLFDNSLNDTQTFLKDYFFNFCHAEERRLLYYHLEGYGFIAIDFTRPDTRRHRMRFYNGKFCTIRVNEAYEMLDCSLFPVKTHFKVLLKPAQLLVVECMLTTRHVRVCRCMKVQELFPIAFDDSNDASGHYRALTWSKDRSQLLTARQEFRLGPEETRVKGTKVYHVDYGNASQLKANTLDMHEDLKRLLLEESPLKRNKQSFPGP